MAANFAPYQDIPESSRALSPPTSPRTSTDRTTRANIISPPPATRAYEQHDYFQGQIHDDNEAYTDDVDADTDTERIPWSHTPAHRGFGRPREDVDMFTTSLGWRLDYEACLAYLLLPPAGGVLLLMLEHKSDYVRFHAWQSSLLFAFAFLIHIIFSWSRWISWGLFLGDVGGIVWLVRRAWVDGRFDIVVFGEKDERLILDSCDVGSI
ncbi:hypothetical protein NX059_006548 [Plenodomus lindquistii]|nr:hypothetical protein NX059_006548 [Plenodomus lindquistii]